MEGAGEGMASSGEIFTTGGTASSGGTSDSSGAAASDAVVSADTDVSADAVVIADAEAGPDLVTSSDPDSSQMTNTSAWNHPPDLMQRSGAPRYDAQDLVRMLGVPANVLWGWEQSLGIPRPLRVRDGHGGLFPRYSDRDVLAVLWLRDQIRAGASPVEAARRLLMAQRSGGLQLADQSFDSPSTARTSGPLTRGPTSGGLQPPATPSLRGSSPTTGSIGLGSATSGPLSRSGAMWPPAGPGADSLRFTSGPLAWGPMTGPASSPLGLGQAIAPVSGPIRGPSTAGFPPGASLPPQQSGAWPQPQQSGVWPQPRQSGVWPQPQVGGSTGAVPPSQALHSTGSLRMLQGALLRACTDLDVSECNRLLDEAFSEYPVETACIRLLGPVVTRAAEMASAGQLSQVAERLAQVTVRDRLAALLDTLGAPAEAPMALLACAPGEFHEIGALMLAVLWRRAGLRTIYLGPDITESALISESRARRPFLICLSAATEAGARGIAHVAAAIARLDPPRPIIGYGGATFVRTPQWQARIHDAYFLGVDAMTATRHVLQLLSDGPIAPR